MKYLLLLLAVTAASASVITNNPVNLYDMNGVGITSTSIGNGHVALDLAPITVSAPTLILPSPLPVAGAVQVTSFPSLPNGAAHIGSVNVDNFSQLSPLAVTVQTSPVPVTGGVQIVGPSPLPVSGTVNVVTAPVYTSGTFTNLGINPAASQFAAPAHAVGFILEADSSNTASVRWAIGGTATSTAGTLAEPGRDTGFVPCGTNISVASQSGTQNVSVQWILSQ